jgi:enoyl-CoA hydratase/carnithine racemase
MAYETILMQRKNQVGISTLKRPDQLNTLSMKLFEEIFWGSKHWSTTKKFTW